MTPKQERFVEEYLVDMNATQAAIRAGYSAKTAQEQGSRLLSNVMVSRAIDEKTADRSERLGITVDFVLSIHKETALRCLQKVAVMEFDHETRSMVQKRDESGQGVWEFDSAGANRAAELMGRHLKMYTDKVDHTSGGAPMKALIGIDLDAI